MRPPAHRGLRLRLGGKAEMSSQKPPDFNSSFVIRRSSFVVRYSLLLAFFSDQTNRFFLASGPACGKKLYGECVTAILNRRTKSARLAAIR